MDKTPPTCKRPDCDNLVEMRKNKKAWKQYCSKYCQDNHSYLKRIETNLAKYGSPNGVSEKRKQTNLAKYGVNNPSKSQQVKDKIKKTFDEKYNGHPMFDKDIKQKVTMSLRENKLSSQALSLLDNKQALIDLNLSCSVTNIARDLGIAYSTVYKKLIEYQGFITLHPPATLKPVSEYETEIQLLLSNLLPDTEIKFNDRNTISNELDIYIPSKNLAIECNGAYWHSETAGNKDRSYHLKKTKECKEKGIHLLHIWQHEWINNRPLIESRIKSLVGVNNRIYARKCIVDKIPNKTAKNFLKNTHIQGSCPSSVSYGLFDNLTLVAVMTFGRSRYDKSIEWELLRYSTQQGVNIVGGAGKLFSCFLKDINPKSVLSYSDRMRNRGKVYEAIGFRLSHSTAPSYYYTKDYRSFENRVAYQKHKLIDKLERFDSSLTEWENMKMNGYDRIWDCGNDVFHWHSAQ
jgi:hypothetical protein